MYTMAVGSNLTSAAGVLSLLSEPEDEIKIFSLHRLNELVDDFWAEVADRITELEVLFERKDFGERELAALVASKVYYHLGAFNESLTFALGAGQRLDVNESSEYVETIISKCIDRYTDLKVKQFDGQLEERIDPQLEDIVDRMFARCLIDRRYKQAIGVAFETRRLDILERVLSEARDVDEMLSYCLRVALALISSPRFRSEVLHVLVKKYEELHIPDYINICQCYIFLNDPDSTAQLLEKLAKGSKDDSLVAYQLAFDLYDGATQHFLRKVHEVIRASLPALPQAPPTTQDGEVLSTPVQETGHNSPSEQVGDVRQETVREERPAAAEASDAMEVDQAYSASTDKPTTTSSSAADNPGPASSESHDPEPEPEAEWVGHLRAVDNILSGEKTVALHQEFLIRNNHTDLQILKNIKEVARNSITHNATVIANGLMHFGTTSDVFLRENLEWLKRASNWAKFSATASLGLIHYGHEKEALNLMSSYLPKDSANSSPYAEGGGLYAIGLIHANHGLTIMDYLSQELRTNNNEVIQHGGCLGLGLAAMGTANLDAYELLKENLMTRDDAVVGEAAGLSMGLVMLGTHTPQAIEDMTNYARDTQHEKIQRGLALGIALLMYGQLEEADPLIEDLCRDKDPLLRRAGVFTIAMAYCGSGDNKAIRRLLHVAVSDVDDDVRRAAVTSLGFILFRMQEQCPHVVSLLSESFNPHVRCGSAMALGVACAGTGNKEALSLLEPMLTDTTPFVQQAALVASAMILIQHTELMSPKAAFYRQHYAKVIGDKHEHTVTKFGAILAQGIINAGGCNVTISLQSRTGHMNMKTAVGLLVFSQFWFWFPLCHFLSLAFTPTELITLNADLKMPKLEFRSNARPSLYAYPAPLKKEKEKQREKVATAVLSVTAKAKAKEKKKAEAAAAASTEAMETESGEKKATSDEASMDTSDSTVTASASKEEAGGGVKSEGGEDKMEVEGKTEEKGASKKVTLSAASKAGGGETTGSGGGDKKKSDEPDFQMIANPARVLPQQLKVLVWEDSCRYKPLKPITSGGIIMLRDMAETHDGPEELIEPLKVVLPGQEEEEEPQPPEPFEWTDI